MQLISTKTRISVCYPLAHTYFTILASAAVEITVSAWETDESKGGSARVNKSKTAFSTLHIFMAIKKAVFTVTDQMT